MANYACHIPKDYSWLAFYQKELGSDRVLKDYETLYSWLLSQPVGWVYHLDRVRELNDKRHRDYTIKLICTFIADNHYDFEFNKTFTQLKRVKINVKPRKLDKEGNGLAD